MLILSELSQTTFSTKSQTVRILEVREKKQNTSDKKTNKPIENSWWYEKIVTDVDLSERGSLLARPADAALPARWL